MHRASPKTPNPCLSARLHRWVYVALSLGAMGMDKATSTTYNKHVVEGKIDPMALAAFQYAVHQAMQVRQRASAGPGCGGEAP